MAVKQGDARTRLPSGFRDSVHAFGILVSERSGWLERPTSVREGPGAACRDGSPSLDGFTVAGSWLVCYFDGAFGGGPGIPPFLTMSGIGLGTLCPLAK